MDKAIEILKKRSKMQENCAIWLSNKMQDLVNKQSGIALAMTWSEFVEKLNELYSQYKRCIVEQTTLGCAILSLENEVEEYD